MKKSVLLLFLFTAVVFIIMFAKKSPEADVLPPRMKAQAMILVDFETGEILYEKNSSQSLPVAGLTQLMTQYIVLNRIDSFKLDWHHTYKPSQFLLDQTASLNHLQMTQGDVYAVEELFKAMTVISANDAATALAEMVAQTEEHFVSLMDEEATLLGLMETKYVNASGFEGMQKSPEKVNKSSAKDLALLSRKLLIEHPVMLHYARMRTFQINDGDVQLNSNLMLEGMPFEKRGIDGLKTGYSVGKGSSFIGTGIFKGRRIVSVVLNVEAVKGDQEHVQFELTEALIDRFIY